MTARSIRRAQERKTRKAAEKSVSESRLFANQANAQLSTGPRTEEGKRKSSLNAVKTALTGHTVLLPSDDAEAYRTHLARFASELQPVGLRESELVQTIANAQWRLQRIANLEMAIFARGRDEFADKFEHAEASARPGLIDLETYLVYEKQLRNLQLQESRLRRQREKDLAELKALQQARRETKTAEPVVAAQTRCQLWVRIFNRRYRVLFNRANASQATIPAAA